MNTQRRNKQEVSSPLLTKSDIPTDVTRNIYISCTSSLWNTLQRDNLETAGRCEALDACIFQELSTDISILLTGSNVIFPLEGVKILLFRLVLLCQRRDNFSNLTKHISITFCPESRSNLPHHDLIEEPDRHL